MTKYCPELRTLVFGEKQILLQLFNLISYMLFLGLLPSFLTKKNSIIKQIDFLVEIDGVNCPLVCEKFNILHEKII